MWKHLFSHVNVSPRNVHILDGNAPNLEAECVAYEAKIKAAGGIDLFLAGIGEDGHIAFNEPGSSLASRTRVKTLAYDTILANSRFFGGDLSKVPRMALTVGVQTVLEAREVVAVILGARKALALQRCVEQGVNHMWTLSSLQLHPHPMIVCDEDATLELQVKTVRVCRDSPTPCYPASSAVLSIDIFVYSTLSPSRRLPARKASSKSFPPGSALARTLLSRRRSRSRSRPSPTQPPRCTRPSPWTRSSPQPSSPHSPPPPASSRPRPRPPSTRCGGPSRLNSTSCRTAWHLECRSSPLPGV